MILSVDHHGLEPVAPHDLAREVRGSSLEGHGRRLDRALQHEVNLKLVRRYLWCGEATEIWHENVQPVQPGSISLLVKRAVLVDDVHDGEWPDEEHAGFIGGVGNNDERCDVVVHLTLGGHAASDHLGRYSRADDVTVIAHVADTELQAELLVSFADNSVLAEYHRFSPEYEQDCFEQSAF